MPTPQSVDFDVVQNFHAESDKILNWICAGQEPAMNPEKHFLNSVGRLHARNSYAACLQQELSELRLKVGIVPIPLRLIGP